MEQNQLCNYARGHYEEHFFEMILNLDRWFKRKCCLKDISYIELWWAIYSAKQNHLCNFGRGHHEKHFCEIILNLDQCFEEDVI